MEARCSGGGRSAKTAEKVDKEGGGGHTLIGRINYTHHPLTYQHRKLQQSTVATRRYISLESLGPWGICDSIPESPLKIVHRTRNSIYEIASNQENIKGEPFGVG
jgi:hypothetical protein